MYKNYSLTEEQADFMVSTATMCPALGDSAVYKARSIHVLFNGTIEYNNELTCLQAGVQFRIAQEKNKTAYKVKIFPNPTFDIIWFDGLAEIEGAINLQITNMLGEQVLNSILLSTQKNINIQNLAAGVYGIKLLGVNSRILFVDKFVKL